MSKRMGKPKPHASERTKLRWRERHDQLTPEDEKKISTMEKLKQLVTYRKFGVEPEIKEDGTTILKGKKSKEQLEEEEFANKNEF